MGIFKKKKSPEQELLIEEELANNPEPRVPVTICIDCSYSMIQEKRLQRLMDGLKTFIKEMAGDIIAKDSVEVCFISYGGDEARVETDFVLAKNLVREGLPELKPHGETPLADAVNLALDNLEERSERYRSSGISAYHPWLIIMGDDDARGKDKQLKATAEKLKEETEKRKLNVLCIMVGDKKDIEHSSLLMLSPTHKVLFLKDLKFTAFFSWLSNSIQKSSQSVSGEEIQYQSTTEWAEEVERSNRNS